MELTEILDELAADENWLGYSTITGVAFVGGTDNEREVMWYDKERLYVDSEGVEFGN